MIAYHFPLLFFLAQSIFSSIYACVDIFSIYLSIYLFKPIPADHISNTFLNLFYTT